MSATSAGSHGVLSSLHACHLPRGITSQDAQHAVIDPAILVVTRVAAAPPVAGSAVIGSLTAMEWACVPLATCAMSMKRSSPADATYSQSCEKETVRIGLGQTVCPLRLRRVRLRRCIGAADGKVLALGVELDAVAVGGVRNQLMLRHRLRRAQHLQRTSNLTVPEAVGKGSCSRRPTPISLTSTANLMFLSSLRM